MPVHGLKLEKGEVDATAISHPECLLRYLPHIRDSENLHMPHPLSSFAEFRALPSSVRSFKFSNMSTIIESSHSPDLAKRAYGSHK